MLASASAKAPACRCGLFNCTGLTRLPRRALDVQARVLIPKFAMRGAMTRARGAVSTFFLTAAAVQTYSGIVRAPKPPPVWSTTPTGRGPVGADAHATREIGGTGFPAPRRCLLEP